MICHDIDEETLHLVIQMQLEDLEHMKNCRKGKQKEGSLPDSEFAFETYQSELKTCEQRVSDRTMSRSIQKATRTDGKLVTVFAAQERQAERDREIALRLSRGETVNQNSFQTSANSKTTSPDEDMSDLDADMLRKLQKLYMSADADDDETLDQPESSSWAASRSDMNGTTKPVKRIPVDNHRPVLGSKLVGQFRAKEVEFSTPNRTYCHQPTCSTFVPVEFIKNDIATCPRCVYKTCAICKGADHQGKDCSQDTATQFLLQVAAENGWQRCFSCRRVVELEHGCNHMKMLTLGISTLRGGHGWLKGRHRIWSRTMNAHIRPGDIAAVSSIAKNATTLCLDSSTNASGVESVLVGGAVSIAFNKNTFHPAFIIY
ncbi:ibr domain-containing protein [Colletotrichum chrysophilum]|uniref:Ibr domain-containing protein n=1 Tax=Colletotrichum chrysophilum TaxID=1836956 RepID=A0AAD9E5X9_9PEZI|nr:ibr domain-containing protein [Colletotrichum chrysophilum]